MSEISQILIGDINNNAMDGTHPYLKPVDGAHPDFKQVADAIESESVEDVLDHLGFEMTVLVGGVRQAVKGESLMTSTDGPKGQFNIKRITDEMVAETEEGGSTITLAEANNGVRNNVTYIDKAFVIKKKAA